MIPFLFLEEINPGYFLLIWEISRIVAWLSCIIFFPIGFFGPLILSTYILLTYILPKFTSISIKILLFIGTSIGAFLVWKFLGWLFVPKDFFLGMIIPFTLIGIFFCWCITTIVLFRKLKKKFFKALSISSISLIFGFLALLIGSKGEVVEKMLNISSFGDATDLCSVLEEYAATHNGYYPISNELRRNKITSLYELTTKRYSTKDNSRLMIAWNRKPYGTIIKWRYVIFVGKETEIKMVSERKFQKLLKEQQGDKK